MSTLLLSVKKKDGLKGILPPLPTSATRRYPAWNPERKEPSPSVLKEIAKALGVPFEELLQAAGILDGYYIEKGREFVAARSDQPIPDDLTEEELAEVKKFIDYILSKRK